MAELISVSKVFKHLIPSQFHGKSLVSEEEEKRKIIQLSPLFLPSTPHVYLKSHQRLATEKVISQSVTLGVLCFDLLACSRLSHSGEDAKIKGTRKILLSSSRSLNSAGPTISEPGTGYDLLAGWLAGWMDK